MKHVLLRNPHFEGVEYGTLRTFEGDIVSITGADIIEIPPYLKNGMYGRFGHGMRGGSLRAYLPKKSLQVQADVLWYILMGPENYELDLFKNWDQAKHRIVYLFDTLEPQFPLLQQIFKKCHFNICITSFADAVPYLESITGQRWHALEQAIPGALFQTDPQDKRVIDFSSYGRRIPSFHEAVKEFCKNNHLYYDYSTQINGQLNTSHEELYKQYAWHLTHSCFTISWPVELTHPSRAGRLNPVTCRWFEAAAAGTVILGRKPNNPSFDYLLTPDLVVEMDPFAEKKEIWKSLEKFYANRFALLQKAENTRAQHFQRWTWEDKVRRILQIIDSAN